MQFALVNHCARKKRLPFSDVPRLHFAIFGSPLSALRIVLFLTSVLYLFVTCDFGTISKEFKRPDIFVLRTTQYLSGAEVIQKV